jgi:hypothetical protein
MDCVSVNAGNHKGVSASGLRSSPLAACRWRLRAFAFWQPVAVCGWNLCRWFGYGFECHQYHTQKGFWSCPRYP